MKFLKNLLITLLSAIFTVVLLYGGYTIYAQSTSNFGGNFSDFRDEYHNTMNNFFNGKMEHLVELIEDDDFFENEDFDAEECLDTSVSTYCVAMQALDIYIAYIGNLNIVKGSLPTLEVDIPTVSDFVEEISIRDEEMEKEAEDARIVMEATIAAYNEFKMAYPMHKKYRSIIENLTKYKIALKKITQQTAEFPLRFIDATSTTCE